jgi:hypothetical protein
VSRCPRTHSGRRPGRQDGRCTPSAIPRTATDGRPGGIFRTRPKLLSRACMRVWPPAGFGVFRGCGRGAGRAGGVIGGRERDGAGRAERARVVVEVTSCSGAGARPGPPVTQSRQPQGRRRADPTHNADSGRLIAGDLSRSCPRADHPFTGVLVAVGCPGIWLWRLDDCGSAAACVFCGRSGSVGSGLRRAQRACGRLWAWPAPGGWRWSCWGRPGCQ